MRLALDQRLAITLAGIAVPIWTLASVPLLGSAWIAGLPLLVFNPVDLAGPLPVEWGCLGPAGPPDAKQVGLIVLLVESLWSVAVLAAPSFALLSYFIISSTEPKTTCLARTYSLSAHLALSSFFCLIWGTLQAIASP